jgi:Peptidase family M23
MGVRDRFGRGRHGQGWIWRQARRCDWACFGDDQLVTLEMSARSSRGHRMRQFIAVGLGLAAACACVGAGVATAAGAAISSAPMRVTPPVADAYTPVIASVVGPPTVPFKGTDGKYHVSYDLDLQNASTMPATLQKLEVVDGADPKKVLASYEGDALLERLRTLNGQAGVVSDALIEPGAGRLFYVDVTLDSLEHAPKAVLHHLALLGARSPRSVVTEATPIDYTITPFSISARAPMVLPPPVTGTGWVAVNACCALEFPHRPSDGSFSGQIVNSQRFATDWKRMNDDGAFYSGDQTKNESYVDYGAKVLAVGDGTVVDVVDTQEANEPGVLPAKDPARAPLLTIGNSEGNQIIIDLGHGVFATYAHLQKGSPKVKKGEKVEKGQVIALLGNTGNSNASHLHFQLANGPSPAQSFGIPYVINRFEYGGQVPAEQFANADDFLTGNFNSQRLSKPQPRTNEFPMSLAIVNLPG